MTPQDTKAIEEAADMVEAYMNNKITYSGALDAILSLEPEFSGQKISIASLVLDLNRLKEIKDEKH